MKSNILVDNINAKLKEFNQELQITKYQANIFFGLNNNIILEERNDIKRFFRRIGPIWGPFFDTIYGLDKEASEQKIKEIKSALCSKGGKNVQKLHGNKIKENLNTGVPWNKDLAGYYPYKPHHAGKTKENYAVLAELSESRKGANNPMFGKSHSKETKSSLSKSMKEKILSGTFTPNIRNSRTHWQIVVGTNKYRSSWEAAYHLLNPDDVYEDIRISYKAEDGCERIYIVDFVNYTQKTFTELKPSVHKEKCVDKFYAANEWGNKNGFIFRVFDEEYFKINESKLRQLDCPNEIMKRLGFK